MGQFRFCPVLCSIEKPLDCKAFLATGPTCGRLLILTPACPPRMSNGDPGMNKAARQLWAEIVWLLCCYHKQRAMLKALNTIGADRST